MFTECTSTITGVGSSTSTTTTINQDNSGETSTIYSGLTTSTTTSSVYNNSIPHINITVTEAKYVVESMSDKDLAEFDMLLANKEQLLSDESKSTKIYQK